MGLWGACAAISDVARLWGVFASASIGIVGLFIALIALAFLWRNRMVQVWSVVLGLALGLCCAGWFATLQHQAQNQVVGQSGTWEFNVVSDGFEGDFATSCFARTKTSTGISFVAYVQLPLSQSPLHYGERFTAHALFLKASGTSAAYCWQQGAVVTARASQVQLLERRGFLGQLLNIRQRAIEEILAHKGDDAGLLAALVCGYMGGLDDSVYSSFKTTGLAHIVAVSGSHLIIIAAFAASALRSLRTPRGTALVLQIVLLLCYLVLVGAPPSAVRSLIMTAASLLSFLARRRASALSALAVCIMFMVGLNPQTALSLSFALSALSTLGIIMFASMFSAWSSQVCRLPRFARDALSLTLAASLFATPLSAALFSQVPLVAPLANIVVAPLFAPICAFGLFAVMLALALPVASDVLMAGACGAVGILRNVVYMLAGIPFASLPAAMSPLMALLFSGILAAILWIKWPLLSKRVLAFSGALFACFMIYLFVVLPHLNPDQIIMLNVGQGDAFVVRSRGAAVLIDTGNQDRLLREALARHGIFHLDAVLLTHGDDDHVGSLSSLAGVVKVDRTLLTNDTLTCQCSACQSLRNSARFLVGENNVGGLSVGDCLRVGVFKLRVIWPEHFTEEGGNADSLCIDATADLNEDGKDDWSTLFVGDAEKEQIDHLVQTGAIGHVDVYKVGHHGSKNALTDSGAAALSPQIALVSVGADNRYGHPTKETLDRLEKVGARLFRTDQQGDVSCTFRAESIQVQTQR